MLLFIALLETVVHGAELPSSLVEDFSRPQAVLMMPEPGDLYPRAVAVSLPVRTPFTVGTAHEARYLKGYAEGYADYIRFHFICRSDVGDRATKEWSAGRFAGYAAAGAEMKKTFP